MLRSIIASFLIFATFLTSQSASAGILIEPYLAYNANVTKYEFGAGAGGSLTGKNYSTSDTGTGFGMRLGYTIPFFFLAADFSSATLKSSFKDNPYNLTSTFEDTKETQTGNTIGANIPLIRPYVGYILKLEDKAGTSTATGTGFKAGIGFSILPLVTLNLEYQSLKWTHVKDTSSSIDEDISASGYYSSAAASGIKVGLSMPFSL